MLIPIINRFTIRKSQIPYMKKQLKHQNLKMILDYTNESSVNHRKNYLEMMDLIEKYPKNYIAVKLSSLDVFSQNRVETYLQNIVETAYKHDSKILIDAENFLIQDRIEKMSTQFMKQYNQNGVHVYKTYQMYRIDSYPLLEHDLKKNRDYFLGIKLVRGAYYNQDFVHNILYRQIHETHENYNKGIHLFKNFAKEKDRLMCATHNEKSLEMATTHISHEQLEIAHLLGMSDKKSKELAKENYNVFKYIPYGNFKDTLPYLIRRLHENYPMITNLWK